MSDLIDDPRPGENAHDFTVAEISGAIRRVIEGEFGRVRVRGEVGRVVLARSGHLYFDLKDDRCVLAAISWKGQVARMRVRPEEGMEVVATGRLTTFGPQSKYQLTVEDIAPAGVGALMAMLEKRKQKLTAEGLFDATRKRPIPYLPQVIGVVTSPTGAVIRDILHRLRDRFPREVLIWPVTVQGERCAAEVAAAIRGFNAIAPGGPIPRPDVLIVARGGGSIEDLWGFNEEIVVRAAAESAIPLISAVGHETDTTLIDHAADRRAPTPTAAAEMAVPVRAELAAALAGLEERRRRALARALEARGQRLRDLARALPRPEALLGERSQRLDAASQRLPGALGGLVRQKALGLHKGRAGAFGPVLLIWRLEKRRTLLDNTAQGLVRGLRRQAERARAKLDGQVLRPRQIARAQADARAALVRLGGRLDEVQTRRLATQRDRLAGCDRMLESLSYTETLRRGFAVVRDANGGLVPGLAAARKAEVLEIEFRDGRLPVLPGKPAPRRRPPSGGEDDEPDQQTLF